MRLSARRDFLKGAISFVAIAGEREVWGAERPRLKFGVISDVHVACGKGQGGKLTLLKGYETDTLIAALRYFDRQRVDAVVMAGDLANSGLAFELRAIGAAWDAVFPNNRGYDRREVAKVFVTGNHDGSGHVYGARVLKDDPELLKREILVDKIARVWREVFHEEYQDFFVKNIRGYDFFGANWKQGVVCNGWKETACNGCYEAFHDRMRGSDPAKPFFYIQHPHPKGTVYGRNTWGPDDGTATRLLSEFPRAVAFSGHSHLAIAGDDAIWRGAFTSIATGSLRYTSVKENGEEKILRDCRTGEVVSVFDERIEITRREFVKGQDFTGIWTIPMA